MLRFCSLTFLLALCFFTGRAQDEKDLPPRPQPAMLVNDLAHTMSAEQVAQLEAKLDAYAQSTSTQIAVVTIKNLGDYDVADYTLKLFNTWGVGQKDKNNGIMLLAAVDNHKMHITTGQGVQGDLTDALCGRIIRNEITPSFKQGDYFAGFSKGVDSIVAATKGEYVGVVQQQQQQHEVPRYIIVIGIIVIYFIFWILSRRRRNGGTYMSGGGMGWFGAGWFLGGGGFGGGDNDGGGFGSGGDSGGFGGFGGGGSDGGGASGSW